MNAASMNQIENNTHKLRNLIISNNYVGNANLNLLVQNLMLIQKMIDAKVESSATEKLIHNLEKETEYFLNKYASEYR